MKYNQKKKKENIEIFLFIMVMAVFAAVLDVYKRQDYIRVKCGYSAAVFYTIASLLINMHYL